MLLVVRSVRHAHEKYSMTDSRACSACYLPLCLTSLSARM